MVASASADHSMYIWNTSTGERVGPGRSNEEIQFNFTTLGILLAFTVCLCFNQAFESIDVFTCSLQYARRVLESIV